MLGGFFMDSTLEKRLTKFRANLPPMPTQEVIGVTMFGSDNNAMYKMGNILTQNQLNNIFSEFEKVGRTEYIEILLNLNDFGRSYEINECVNFYRCTNGRLYSVMKLLDLLKNDDMAKFNKCVNIIRSNVQQAVEYLDSINAPLPQKLSDINLEDSRLYNLLTHTAPAGLSFDQKQEINKKYGEAIIETEKAKRLAYDKASIEITKTRSEHDESIRFEKEKIDENIQPSSSNDGVVKVDYDFVAQELIKQNTIAREKEEDADGNYPLIMWDENLKSYRYLTRKDETNRLFSAFKKLAYATYGYNISLSDGKIDDKIKSLRIGLAPTVEEWGLIRAKENQLFFGNGYYNFDDAKFCEADTRKYLHFNAISFYYDENAPVPKYYNEMIKGMFDNENTRKLGKQVHGALLYEGNLKSLFALQGVSQGGKSTYAEVPIRLLPKSYVQNLSAISDIDANKIRNLETKARILYVDDAPNKPLNPNTVSYMKICSRGVNGGTVYHKIIIGTNHPIYSEKGTATIEEALGERIVVLPFKNNLKEMFENGAEEKKASYREIRDYFVKHFEDEKQGIVKEIIAAFQEVYDNDKIFKIKYPLNACIASVKNVSPEAFDSSDDSENDDNLSELSEKEIRLQRLIESDFDFSNDETHFMKSEDVFKYVDKKLPNYFGRKEEVGKALIRLFGDDIKWSKRKDNKTWYKIMLIEDME